MVARPGQDAKRLGEGKADPVGAFSDFFLVAAKRGTFYTNPTEKVIAAILTELAARNEPGSRRSLEEALHLLRYSVLPADAPEVVLWELWDAAVESRGRSAQALEELAESTGAAIARISARGDRIDRIQKETRALLNALAAPEADH